MKTEYCGLINDSFIDRFVELCGWVHRRRDHGGIIFVDLRDREGLVQIVFAPENNAVFETAEKLRNEFVIHIKGKVRHRPEGTVNKDLPSGHVEVLVEMVDIINSSQTPPFRIDEYQEIGEEVRLKYRYIDLRRPEMAEKMKLRHQICRIMREFLNQHLFLEIETPILTKATPEGARDYLVPSRNYPGEFYALPQSPQIFKQLLMVAGIDRYYQIARCFRDEDLRADRQPEFTQLDLEMAFIREQDIQRLMENLMRQLFSEILHITLPETFPYMTYAEAIQHFGSDRPDLRIPLEFIEISDLMQEVEFKVFANPAKDKGSRVVVLHLPKGGDLTRKEIDDYTQFVGQYGAKGLAYIKVNDIHAGMGGLQSPILKFLPENVIQEILKRTQAKNGDLLFFGADKAKIVNDALGALRIKLGHDRGLVDNKEWRFVWIVDFPMFEWDEKEKRWQAVHHPFTAPKTDNPEMLAKDPKSCL